ncbi:hypothetical protein LCGC14_0311030 [marine sediment metagenome]|uniref:RNA ligase domain-containing protein n=1 Tax=marine sediment metagenome TaxID=412755 RepID=A0A0F9TME0_9ZZZZ
MTDSWHSYPSVYALGHSALVGLLEGDVVVQEKIDGSQFSFGIIDGELKVRSKGKLMEIDAPEKMFAGAVKTVKNIASDLIPDWTYRAEVLSKPKHNALKYDRVPEGNLILFDINIGLEKYKRPSGLAKEAHRLGLEFVPTFYSDDGVSITIDVITEFLLEDSCLGGTKIEGIVIKNYSRFGKDKKVLMGKYVSEAFKEVHRTAWSKANPHAKDIVQSLVETYRTESRWQKAVQHLQERGELEGSPRDIGKLIKETQEDIYKESSDDIKFALFVWAWPKVQRAVIAGLPEWYKESLLAKQFESEEDTDA